MYQTQRFLTICGRWANQLNLSIKTSFITSHMILVCESTYTSDVSWLCGVVFLQQSLSSVLLLVKIICSWHYAVQWSWFAINSVWPLVYARIRCTCKLCFNFLVPSSDFTTMDVRHCRQWANTASVAMTLVMHNVCKLQLVSLSVFLVCLSVCLSELLRHTRIEFCDIYTFHSTWDGGKVSLILWLI